MEGAWSFFRVEEGEKRKKAERSERYQHAREKRTGSTLTFGKLRIFIHRSEVFIYPLIYVFMIFIHSSSFGFYLYSSSSFRFWNATLFEAIVDMFSLFVVKAINDHVLIV